MHPALIALNIVVWLAVVVYLFRIVPALAKRWDVWIALTLAVVAGGTTYFSFRVTGTQQAKKKAEKHYIAGIGARNSGDLTRAEEQLEEALALDPGNPQAKEALEEIRLQKPAETRIPPKGASSSTGSAPAPSPAPTPPPNTPAGNTPPQSKGTPGTKPKPVPHKNSPFEITRYALDVDLDPIKHTLDAKATFRVKSRGGDVPTLELSLNPECKPFAATLDGQPVAYNHTNDLLTLSPRNPVTASKETEITVQYRRAGEAKMGGGTGLLAAKGSYFLSESRWYPATGELDFRAPVRVSAHVPKGYKVVSVGELKRVEKDAKGTRFHWETERLAAMVSLAASKYEEQSLAVPPPAGVTRPPLKITCYTFPEHKARAKAFLKEAASIVRFYEKLMGPYPYEKLGIAEIPLFPGGYGTTSFVMLIDLSFAQKKVDREFLAHEIAHQWWGNSVFPQGMGAAWLSEAFANYSAWMYDASINGNPKLLRKRVVQATRDYFNNTQRKGDQAIYESDPYLHVGAREQIIYEKGAVVLHMLRSQLGDAAFRKLLLAFAKEYRFGKADIAAFKKTVKEQTGQDLDWFFDQWLGRTGGMQLAYNFTTEADGPQQNAGVITFKQTGQPYRAKLRLKLQVENNVVEKELELTEAEQTFRFPVQGKLFSVLIDPDNTYLMAPPRWETALVVKSTTP